MTDFLTDFLKDFMDRFFDNFEGNQVFKYIKMGNLPKRLRTTELEYDNMQNSIWTLLGQESKAKLFQVPNKVIKCRLVAIKLLENETVGRGIKIIQIDCEEPRSALKQSFEMAPYIEPVRLAVRLPAMRRYLCCFSGVVDLRAEIYMCLEG